MASKNHVERKVYSPSAPESDITKVLHDPTQPHPLFDGMNVEWFYGLYSKEKKLNKKHYFEWSCGETNGKCFIHFINKEDPDIQIDTYTINICIIQDKNERIYFGLCRTDVRDMRQALFSINMTLWARLAHIKETKWCVKESTQSQFEKDLTDKDKIHLITEDELYTKQEYKTMSFIIRNNALVRVTEIDNAKSDVDLMVELGEAKKDEIRIVEIRIPWPAYLMYDSDDKLISVSGSIRPTEGYTKLCLCPTWHFWVPTAMPAHSNDNESNKIPSSLLSNKKE